MANCLMCDGTGTIKCPTCGGQGRKYLVPILGLGALNCSGCNGQGEINCPNCEGYGEVGR